MARHRILVVDDCPEDCELYCRFLEISDLIDAEIEIAETGVTGLEAVRRGETDCVILDQNLPDCNGTEFLSELQFLQDPPPVIMITGAGSEKVAAECVRLGARDYLVKGSFRPHELVRAVRYAISDRELKKRILDQREEQERFAHIAAHDLRSPLQKIGGFCTLLQHHVQGQSDETDDILDRILKNVHRMSDLVDGLLEYARTGRGDAPRDVVDLDEELRVVMSDLSATPGFESAEFRIDSLPNVAGDATSLRQVLQNLIANALKFQEPGNPVRVEVGGEHDERGCRIWVRDNGIGIDPQDQRRIFEPLERLHPQSKYPGTGLGLTQCQKILRSHGGKIDVESARGQGATFYLSFPPDRYVEVPLAA
ncbi:MAG: ATP-binding protein [Candidatus Eisenbacteria bacterium]